MGEPSQKIFRGQKHAKFDPILVDFKVQQQISLERMKIFTIYELLDLCQFLRLLAKKSGEHWSANCGDLNVESYTPKLTFLEDHFLASRGAAPKFLHALENDQVLLVHPPPKTRVSLTIFSRGGPKLA